MDVQNTEARRVDKAGVESAEKNSSKEWVQFQKESCVLKGEATARRI